MSNRKMNSHVSGERADQRLIDHYQSQQLSSSRLHTIMNERQTKGRNRTISFALAASLLLFSLAFMTHQHILASQQTDTVLREAALNHSSKLKMDSEAQTLVGLQGELDELLFEMKLPESSFFNKLAVLGGRYCTISGQLAAHLKLADLETSEQYSLFLTPSGGSLTRLKSDDVDVAGVDVKLWHENNVVYALASNTGRSL